MRDHFQEKQSELRVLLSESRELLDPERRAALALRQESVIFFARIKLWDRATTEVQGSIDLIRQWEEESGRR